MLLGMRSCGICGIARLVGVACVGVVILSGCCRPAADVVLVQPFAVARQREVHLTAREAYSWRDGERQKCLVVFALPGSEWGPPAYRLYLDLPAGAGASGIGSGDAAARGFLLQETGQYAGRSNLSGGSLRWRKRWLSSELALVIDTTAEDGTRVHGAARLRERPQLVKHFEQLHAGDVATLRGDEQ